MKEGRLRPELVSLSTGVFTLGVKLEVDLTASTAEQLCCCRNGLIIPQWGSGGAQDSTLLLFVFYSCAFLSRFDVCFSRFAPTSLWDVGTLVLNVIRLVKLITNMCLGSDWDSPWRWLASAALVMNLCSIFMSPLTLITC